MGDIDTKGIIVGVGIMLMLVGNLDIMGIIVVVGDGVNVAKQENVSNASVLSWQEFEAHELATHVPNTDEAEVDVPEQVALALQELAV